MHAWLVFDEPELTATEVGIGPDLVSVQYVIASELKANKQTEREREKKQNLSLIHI